jgi:hypothetical protein
MRLGGAHYQAFTRPLPYDELAWLQCSAAQARLVVDLVGQGYDLALAVWRQPRSRM